METGRHPLPGPLRGLVDLPLRAFGEPFRGTFSRAEIAESFERLINKLLHPPLESLRDEARHGVPHGLMDALKRLFRLKE